jgi:hypothetical protein
LGSTVRRLLAVLLVLAALLLLPNLVWLERSTLRIENRSPDPIAAVRLRACGEIYEVGSLEAGEAYAGFLPACGDDSLTVMAPAASAENAVCTIYVEGDMYHVDVWFTSPTTGDCAYDFPPFSALFVRKMLL